MDATERRELAKEIIQQLANDSMLAERFGDVDTEPEEGALEDITDVVDNTMKDWGV